MDLDDVDDIKESITKDLVLEKEYQDLVNSVNEQLTIAAAALNAAADLAAKKNSTVSNLSSKIENLSYDEGLDIPDVDSYKLMRAIRNAGWSSSSMSC
jgi:ATP-dependent protease Clp ATPase subunit